MSELILKYIAEEKDIARYKATLLKKGSPKQYKDRLLCIERDFIEYPFEKISSSIPDAQEAMTLFRSDRHAFYDKYERGTSCKQRVVTESQRGKLESKRDFYKEVYERIIDFEIKEVNVIQNAYIKSLLKYNDSDLDSHGMDYLLGLEGAFLAKARARIQVLLYCLSRCIHKRLKALTPALSGDLSPLDYDRTKAGLDSLLMNYSKDLFEYYNEGIIQVPNIINGTLGHNSFVSATYPLANLVDKYDETLFLKRSLDRSKAFFTKTGNPIRRKFVERGFSVKTPMRRVGNESISLLYLDIWSKRGIRMTSVFEREFFSLKVSGEYYKAVSTKPVWMWSSLSENPYLKRELLGMIASPEPLSGSLDFSDPQILEATNRCGNASIEIDGDASKMMIAATRSEADHIAQAMKYVFEVINSIESEYKRRFRLV